MIEVKIVREQLLSAVSSSWATTSACAPLHSSGSPPHLILASTSPRRAQLVGACGVPFTVLPPHVDEPAPTAEDETQPAHYVERLAEAKAAACDVSQLMAKGQSLPPTAPTGIIVIAADTVVWHDGRILNKPRDGVEAQEMLRRLRGQTHQVFTGVCVRCDGSALPYQIEHEVTGVTFRDVSDAWVDCYVATGEPMDKAGAYAAQGLGALIMERIDGDFYNVVGLPLGRLGKMLSRVGAPIEMWWREAEAKA